MISRVRWYWYTTSVMVYHYALCWLAGVDPGDVSTDDFEGVVDQVVAEKLGYVED